MSNQRMELIGELDLSRSSCGCLCGILVLAGIYIAVSLICYAVWYFVRGRKRAEKGDFTARKTVTFRRRECDYSQQGGLLSRQLFPCFCSGVCSLVR